MGNGNSDTIVKFHKKHKFNLGMAIFAVILVYIVVCIVLSFKETQITGYQVKKGSLSQNKIYEGIALRSENIVNCDETGYINYFINEGERASYGNIVYCLDESGKISDLLGKDPTEDSALTEDELFSLKQQMKLFSKNYNGAVFSEAYSFDKQIDTEVNQIENRRILSDIDSLNTTTGNDIISYFKAKNPGIVLMYYDGFENATADSLTAASFNKDNYVKNEIFNDDLVEAGSFAYKYIFNENWQIAILVANEDINTFEEGDYIDVKFSETGTTSYGCVHIGKSFDDYTIVTLSFTNSMVSFAKERFIEIELLLEDDAGLKVPNSAIAEKSFFLVDKAFVSNGGNKNTQGVYRKEYSDAGETIKFVEITPYKETDDEVYVDSSVLNYGDVLIKEDSAIGSTDENTFTVSKMGTLIGVYNINKGYADFKRVDVLYSNDEYSIVKANDSYGLNAYDYIALDASTVSEDDFVY